MPRLLKSRDYTTGELVEISEHLIEATTAERHFCYNSADREKNSIRLAFFKQIKKRLEKDNIEESKNTATQGGLF